MSKSNGSQNPGRTYAVAKQGGLLSALFQQAPETVQGAEVKQFIDPNEIQSGDVVIGVLPYSAASQIVKNGGRFVHASLDRQKNLELEEFEVTSKGEFKAEDTASES